LFSKLKFHVQGASHLAIVKQYEIPRPKAEIILQKEAKAKNHADRELRNVLKCPYAGNKAHVAISTLTLNHCKQN